MVSGNINLAKSDLLEVFFIVAPVVCGMKFDDINHLQNISQCDSVDTCSLRVQREPNGTSIPSFKVNSVHDYQVVKLRLDLFLEP